METSLISPARLSLINKLRHIERMGIFSLTRYDQDLTWERFGPFHCGCLAGLAIRDYHDWLDSGITALGLKQKPFTGCWPVSPGLFYQAEFWPHAYQTMYAHDRVEAGIQAILAVNEYGDFPYPSREPVKLPDIMKSLADQIDQIQLNEREKYAAVRTV